MAGTRYRTNRVPLLGRARRTSDADPAQADPDALDMARGIIFGVPLGVAIWMLLALLAWLLF